MFYLFAKYMDYMIYIKVLMIDNKILILENYI